MNREPKRELNLTSEELARVFGLLAMLETDGVRRRVLGTNPLENDLDDWVCDHDFYD